MTIPPLSLGLSKGAEWLKALHAEMFSFGQAHGLMNKSAERASVHALAGRLQAGPGGNLELTVPSSLIKGVFDALDEPGAEFVVRNNRTESAIKVMTKDEVDKLGGINHITERGHSYHYTLGPIVELPATGGYDKLWAISIQSDDLENIRRSYGLETSPQLGFYIPVGTKKSKVTEDNKVSKLAGSSEDRMYLYSYIPSGAIKNVKEHGLLSGNELAKPENRHFLDIARPDGDADRWLKEREARLAKSPWTTSYNGPSVLFGDIDPAKIHDKHPIMGSTRVKINLHELLKDYPATKLEGSELIPFSDEVYDALDEKGQNEFVNKRHHTLSLEEIKSLISRGHNPKDMWKDFKDTEGRYYASDVPHAHVVTPMGRIPSKYIEFDEEPPVSKLAGSYTVSGEKVQGVGLRKLYHSLLDEQGLPGLGVNNESTGEVELSFDGDEKKRQEVFDRLGSQIQAKTGHPVTFAPVDVPQSSVPIRMSNKDTERLNAIHHLAYRMSNMYDPADSLMDSNDNFKQKLADRFRLQVSQRGLKGTVPSRAAEQLLGTRPMYQGMMPDRLTRTEEEALSDMAEAQKQRLMKALSGGRGFLATSLNNRIPA